MREATTEELLERIKELEENEQVLNDAHCKLLDKLEEKDSRIKELEADYEAVMHAALVHSDENDKLNKELEDAENRIKELEKENHEQAMNFEGLLTLISDREHRIEELEDKIRSNVNKRKSRIHTRK